MDTNLHLLRISNLFKVTIKEASNMKVEFISATKHAALVKINGEYKIL